jgi:hypothetical protein
MTLFELMSCEVPLADRVMTRKQLLTLMMLAEGR